MGRGRDGDHRRDRIGCVGVPPGHTACIGYRCFDRYDDGDADTPACAGRDHIADAIALGGDTRSGDDIRGIPATSSTARDGHGHIAPSASATTAGPDRGAGAATGDHDAGTAAAPGNASSACRPATGYLLGYRDEGPRRRHHGDVCGRFGTPEDTTERLYPVVVDRYADLSIRRRLGTGLQPLPGEPFELLDHHKRRDGALIEPEQRRADELLMASDAADIASSRDRVDRVLIGACAVIWLILVAVSVAAIVALVDLGRGHRASTESGASSWLLWTIIAVSAAIIVGAVPLLLRARATAEGRAAAEEEATQAIDEVAAPVRPIGSRTGRMRVFGTSVDPYDPPLPQSQPAPRRNIEALNRVWLRGTVSLVCAIGLGLTGVGAMTYLLATSSTTAAWVAMGFAGVVTVAMPAVLVAFVRQLGDVLDETAA